VSLTIKGRPIHFSLKWLKPPPVPPDGTMTLFEHLRELLIESVKLHEISDVPFGAFLSGGIDSSAVVGTMAGLTSDRVKTFSIGFAEAEYDELRHARRVADAFGPTHWANNTGSVWARKSCFGVATKSRVIRMIGNLGSASMTVSVILFMAVSSIAARTLSSRPYRFSTRPR